MTRIEGCGLKLAVAMLALGWMGCSGQVDQNAPKLPGGEATVTIPATANTTQSLGVSEWRIFEQGEGVLHVYGVDTYGQVASELRVRVDATADRQGIIGVESLYPESGMLVVKSDGTVIEQHLAASSRLAVESARLDMLDALNNPNAQYINWGCWRATAVYFAGCIAGAAGCTTIAWCAVGGALCLDAYFNMMCHCHHRFC